jgi:small basic protein
MVSTLCFGSVLGLKEAYIVPDTHSSFEGLNITAALGSYFAVIFAIADWPFRKRRPNECVHPIAETTGSG